MRRLGGFAVVAIAPVIMLSWTSRAQAQGEARISGRITNPWGAPIAQVEVWATGFNVSTKSDSSGRYEMNVPVPAPASRRVALLVRLVGYYAVYDTVVLAPGELIRDYLLLRVPSPRPHVSRTDSTRLARGEPLPACLPADADEGLLIWMFRSTVTESGDGPGPTNRALSGLPHMDSAAAERRITQVESGPLCDLAVKAFNKAIPDRDSLARHAPRRVWLVRVDSLYLVNDPNIHAGEWTPVITFNSQWVVLFSVLR
jgi:hypothetical protein